MYHSTSAGFKCRLLVVRGTALSWFKSNLEGRSQRICIKETLSQPFDLKRVSLKVLVQDRFCLLFIHKTCSLNASARLIYCARKSCPITPLLRELHWLLVCCCFEYKIRKIFARQRRGCMDAWLLSWKKRGI